MLAETPDFSSSGLWAFRVGSLMCTIEEGSGFRARARV